MDGVLYCFTQEGPIKLHDVPESEYANVKAAWRNIWHSGMLTYSFGLQGLLERFPFHALEGTDYAWGE